MSSAPNTRSSAWLTAEPPDGTTRFRGRFGPSQAPAGSAGLAPQVSATASAASASVSTSSRSARGEGALPGGAERSSCSRSQFRSRAFRRCPRSCAYRSVSGTRSGGQFQAEARVGDDAHRRLERARGRADGAHDGPFRRFSGVDQRPDAVQSGQRVKRELGTVESFLPQAGPRPEALQNGRYAEGGRIQWLGHLPFFSGCTTAKIVADSLADKSR